MKIGLVCPYNVFKGGGVQECVTALHAELNRRGHEIKIVTPLPRKNRREAPADTLFIGRARDVKSPFSTTAQVSISLDNDSIDEILKNENFDILHFHEPWVPMVSMQILARSHSINVATFHAKLPETAMSRTIEKVITPYTRSIMKYLNGLTAVSEAAAEYVRTITDQPLEIIPNGIDLSVYGKVKSQPSVPPFILYVGRLERRKGVMYLLKAYRQLVAEGSTAKLVIAGDGPDRAKLEDYVREKGLSGITFKGYVSTEEKLELLGQATLFAAPALFGESFGIVLLEAMAAGLPVVAGNNPGYTAVLKEMGELSIVNPKDTKEFARRLSVMLNSNDLRRLWSDWARQYIKQYDYPKVVDQYEALYERLCRQKDA